MNSFFLDQHGCAKNQVDGEILITRLLDKGFSRVEDPKDANLILINTCGFIESAKQESLESVFAAREEYPNAKIVLCGCLAERYAEVFSEELSSEVDAILGNGDLSLLDEVVEGIEPGESDVQKFMTVYTRLAENIKFEGIALKFFMNVRIYVIF